MGLHIRVAGVTFTKVELKAWEQRRQSRESGGMRLDLGHKCSKGGQRGQQRRLTRRHREDEGRDPVQTLFCE